MRRRGTSCGESMPEPDQPSPQVSSGDTSVDPDAPIAQPADVAPVPDTEELLRQAESKAQEHHDTWLRAKAEAENIRKRSVIELANAYKYAIEAVAADLLPVKDSLEATLAADSAALEALRSGVELTLKQLNAVFAKAALTEINPIGEKLNPHRHKPTRSLPSETNPTPASNFLQKGTSLP